MYYTNTLIFYSVIGFILESTIYKINHSRRHSGICYGPVTYVYGFGILSLVLLKKYFLDRFQGNRYVKLMVTFFTCWITLTLIEWLGGTILNAVFEIDMWNYSNKAFHCGKYICLELSVVWGILGTLYIYYIKDFFDQFLKTIPKKLTYALLVIQFIDIVLVFVNKFPKW